MVWTIVSSTTTKQFTFSETEEMKSLILAFMVAFMPTAFSATTATPAPKIDCTQKKNAKKLECKEAPKSDVKAAVKKPEKVRKAPTSVQKKAEKNTSEK